MSKALITLFLLLFIETVKAQKTVSDSVVKKTGWIIFSEQIIFWVEAPLTKNVKHTEFFRDTLYRNGLRIGGHYKALYFSFLAKEFVNDYFKDIKIKTAEDSSLKYFWLMPVIAEIHFRPSSDLFIQEEMEKLFLANGKKVAVLNKWERDYYVGDFDFLRKDDRLKASRHLAKLKEAPDEYYGQKGYY